MWSSPWIINYKFHKPHIHWSPMWQRVSTIWAPLVNMTLLEIGQNIIKRRNASNIKRRLFKRNTHTQPTPRSQEKRKRNFCFIINTVIMTPVYVCVLSFTKMHDCKHIISCTRNNNVLYWTILKKNVWKSDKSWEPEKIWKFKNLENLKIWKI